MVNDGVMMVTMVMMVNADDHYADMIQRCVQC